MLNVCYDLARNPPTFDFVTALLRFERLRLEYNEEGIALNILPGPNGGFRQDKLWPQSIDTRKALLDRVVLPMASMLPSIRRVTLHQSRDDAPRCFGIGEHIINFRRFVDCYRSGVRPLRPSHDLSPDDQLIALTLRESEHWPERNSNLPQWHRAGLELSMMGFNVIVVRDTLKADEPLGSLTTSPSASRELMARAQLYRRAACNVFVNNGPAWLSVALDAPTIILRPATEGGHAFAGAAGRAKQGIPAGSQLPNAPRHQRLVWESDTSNNIVAAVVAFMRHADQRIGTRRPSIHAQV